MTDTGRRFVVVGPYEYATGLWLLEDAVRRKRSIESPDCPCSILECVDRAELERLRKVEIVMNKIAERTGSNDPCRHFVQMARDALRGATP